MPKFKIGDKVRHGKRIDIVESVPGMSEYDKRGFTRAKEGFLLKESGWEFQENWESVIESEPQPHIRQVIVKCPTKEDFKRVVKQAIEDGNKMCPDGNKMCPVCYGEGEEIPQREEILINGMGQIHSGNYIESSYRKEYTILTAQEYLNKFKQPAGEETYPMYCVSTPIRIEETWVYSKPKGKIMSIIKNIFKSKEQKALSYYELTNGDGGLTPIGREEFIDYLWEEMKEERNGFIERIVEEYSKEKKEK